MAELALGNAGAAIGGAVLPEGVGAVSGAAIGRAIGSLAGAAIDARYLTPPIEGARIGDIHITQSREGVGIPVVYGRMRVGGNVIWAAEFRENRETVSGKGGPPVREYSYSLSFAVGLCEGEVARVSRCWANGEPFDLSAVTWRLYRGTEDQAPDPLIEALEGTDQTPAYLGLAYIVFEDMPVDRFGVRMPQLSFEIVRPVAGGDDRMEAMARSVNLIPGSGEFALATDVIRRSIGPGREVAENQNDFAARADLISSLDQLEAEMPAVTRVNLVVCWFGDDLRCGECRIRPGVEVAEKTTKPWDWSVGATLRGGAHVVSQVDGRPAFGGTPADEAVRQAVAELKVRGYHVTLYPFLLMDVPADNGLDDPHGAEEQPVYPWRGRIACHPAPGQPGTVDGSADADEQVEAFFGGGEGYRDFVMHYAGLAAETGADGLLIGSELVGLTRVRGDGGAYPTVEHLRELAADVRGVVGPDVEISYAADWTEYGAHVDGGDVTFPLDPLWADECVDYVGLDWYPPQADWRDGDAHADAAWGDGRSRAYLAANVAGGEAYDWYYADGTGRSAQDRLAITDGAYGEPFVFRQKDVAGWWGGAHHPRVDGVRSSTSTAWTPGMKPVRFVEFGCPAVEKGANQPNVFFDPKSSESALPHYSDGSRDDLVQRRAIEAFLAHWADTENNPASSVYADRMIADDGVSLWAWDVRPFPAWPANDAVWGDADNWRLGHWLNGRAGAALLPDIVADICLRAGADADVSGLQGIVGGYRHDGPVAARSALEPLRLAHGFDVSDTEGVIAFRQASAAVEVAAADVVELNAAAFEDVRASMEAPETRVRLRFLDPARAHEQGVVLTEGSGAEIVDVALAMAMDVDEARRCAEWLARDLDDRRELTRFALAGSGSGLEPGDVVQVAGRRLRVAEVSDQGVVQVTAVRAGSQRALVLTSGAAASPDAPAGVVEPDVVIVEAPALPGQESDHRPLAFVWSDPWPGPVIVSAAADGAVMRERGRISAPCAIGRLAGDLYPHVSGRWQDAEVWVSLPGGELQSRSDGAVLNGANAALVETGSGWEMIQFANAELMGLETWRLSRLLRGQQGSDSGEAASAGGRIVFLTGAERRLDVGSHEHGLLLDWRAWRNSPHDGEAWSHAAVHEPVAGRMWSPAHFRAAWVDDDIHLSWVRRAARGGDGWDAAEPWLDGLERYRVSVSDAGVTIRVWDVGALEAVYGSEDRAVDFPTGGETTISVAQIGPDSRPGSAARLTLSL